MSKQGLVKSKEKIGVEEAMAGGWADFLEDEVMWRQEVDYVESAWKTKDPDKPSPEYKRACASEAANKSA